MRSHLATFIEFIIAVNKTRGRFQPLWLNCEVLLGMHLVFLLVKNEKYEDIVFDYLLSVEAVGNQTDMKQYVSSTLSNDVLYRVYASVLTYTVPDADYSNHIDEIIEEIAENGGEEINRFLKMLAIETKRHFNYFKHGYDLLYEGIAR